MVLQSKLEIMNSSSDKTVAALLQALGAALQRQPNPQPKRPPNQNPTAPTPSGRYGRSKQAAPSLPKWMERLDVKCADHFAPVPTTFHRATTSDKGHPLAHYKCPVCSKNYFIASSPEGKPFCLFVK